MLCNLRNHPTSQKKSPSYELHLTMTDFMYLAVGSDQFRNTNLFVTQRSPRLQQVVLNADRDVPIPAVSGDHSTSAYYADIAVPHLSEYSGPKCGRDTREIAI